MEIQQPPVEPQGEDKQTLYFQTDQIVLKLDEQEHIRSLNTTSRCHPTYDKQFQEKFNSRINKLQKEGRMLRVDEITSHLETEKFNIQLEMVHEYTCRSLSLPWSPEPEYTYGDHQMPFEVEIFTKNEQALVGWMNAGIQDKRLLEEIAQEIDVNLESIIGKLRSRDMVDESNHLEYRRKNPDSINQKKFYEL